MTPRKPFLSHAPDTAQHTTNSCRKDWQAWHYRAMQHPVSGFERALVTLLRGWQEYADAHQSAYDATIHADGVLSESWAQIGEGLLGLLNGQLGRLDGGILDRMIRGLLSPDEADAPFPVRADAPTAAADQEDTSAIDPRILAFSRAGACEDGVLIDVTFTAQEAGYRIPVALSRALWADIRAVPERLQGVSDFESRLWDVLMAGRDIIAQQGATSWCRYSLAMPVGEAWLYAVQAHCDLDDAGEPVVTLMQPGECW